jgi:hypothetical protein
MFSDFPVCGAQGHRRVVLRACRIGILRLVYHVGISKYAEGVK